MTIREIQSQQANQIWILQKKEVYWDGPIGRTFLIQLKKAE